MVDHTDQGVHPFTQEWWGTLPTVYRRADRAQGFRVIGAWEGLNRDPRFITGYDGWHRTNLSSKPWEATLGLSRTFRPSPNVPVNIRTWHHPDTPDTAQVTVRHTVRNHTGTIVADTTATFTTDVQHTHHTTVVPDRFGTIQVTIQVTVSVPDARNLVEAVHVGTTDPAFTDLPGIDYFATASAYPLLRFMDGIGHQAGYLSDRVNDMHEGGYTNPVTAPESALGFLANILGVSRRYSKGLSRAQLRQHLVDIMEGETPAPGSVEHIAITARQYITGSREVSVTPAHAVEGFTTAPEEALSSAMGVPVRKVHVRAAAPVPENSYQWVGAVHASPSTKHHRGVLVAENLVINPRFHVSLTDWLGTRATITRDTTDYEISPASMRVVPTDTGWYALNDYVTATETTTMVMRLRVKADAQTRVVPYVWKYDGDIGGGGPSVLLRAGEWTTIEAIYDVTAGRRHRVAIRPYDSNDLTPVNIGWAYDARVAYDSGHYFDGSTPDTTVDDIWVKTTDPVGAYTWNGDTWVEYTTTTVTDQIQAVIDERENGDLARTHTLIVSARATEVPGNDLAAFAQFLNDAGVIPAGHRVITREATQSWDQWTAAVGQTWSEHSQVVKTWNDHDSAGVSLD